jgi:hypothetical protein
MPTESEWQTRKDRIDTRLGELGWDVRPHSPSFQADTAHATAVAEYPTANGPADYALFVDGRPLGIIEAKKLSLGSTTFAIRSNIPAGSPVSRRPRPWKRSSPGTSTRRSGSRWRCRDDDQTAQAEIYEQSGRLKMEVEQLKKSCPPRPTSNTLCSNH